MILSKSGVSDHKQHSVDLYTMIIDDVELNWIYNKLFGDLDNVTKVSNTIKDNLLTTYIKTYVANTFMEKVTLERGKTYKISIKAKEVDIDMMISLHDKLDEVFY